MHHVGVLAYGSLIVSPGSELKRATGRRIEDVLTPFRVEFARISDSRGGAPTLVPVHSGGSQVRATVLVMSDATSLSNARNMTYRREIDRVGESDVVYTHRESLTQNQVHLPVLDDFSGVEHVIYTMLGDTIPEASRNGQCLAQLALKSVGLADPERDGITYLRDAMSMGVQTPLTEDYRDEVLRRTDAASLDEAIASARSA